MELIKELELLEKDGKLNIHEVSKLTSVDQLMFLIKEQVVVAIPDYTKLYNVFEELREVRYAEAFNVFQESLNLKYYYFNSVYGVNIIVLNAILLFIGPVALDYELEEILADNKFYKFYIKRYEDFVKNNEYSVYRLITDLVKNLDIQELVKNNEELQSTIKELEKKIN